MIYGSITEIEQAVDAFLKSAFPKAAAEAILTYAGCALFAVGVSLLLFAVFRHASAYVSEKLTKKKFHYTLMALAAVFAGAAFIGVSGAAAVLFSILTAIITAAGIYLLAKRRKAGVLLTLISLWFSLPVKEFPKLIAVAQDRAELSAYTAAGRMAVFAADTYIFDRVAVLAVTACILTVAVVVYYTKRRYMFRTERETVFGGVSCCPTCTSPIVTNGKHCPVCGEATEGRPHSVLKWVPLDMPEYCVKCGKRLHGEGGCSECDPDKSPDKAIKQKLTEDLSDKAKGIICSVLIAVFVVVPALLGSAASDLAKGSAAVNNAYVAKFNEWYSDESAAEDPQWRKGFDDASKALFDFNAKGLRIDTGNLNYRQLYVYVQYVEASYYQMAVIERTEEAVHSGDATEKERLSAYFNSTIDMQQRALAGGLMLKPGMAANLVNLPVDSGRFYLNLLPDFLLAALLLAAGLAGAVAGSILYFKKKDASPFINKAPAPEKTVPELIKEEQKHKRYVREERGQMLLGILIAAAIFGVSFAVSSAAVRKNAPTPESRMHSAFMEDGASLITWFSQCDTDPDKAYEQLGEVIGLIAGCREDLDALAADDEADRDAAQLAAVLSGELAGLQNEAENGKLPDKDMIKRVSELILRGMQLDGKRLIEESMDQLGEAFD